MEIFINNVHKCQTNSRAFPLLLAQASKLDDNQNLEIIDFYGHRPKQPTIQTSVVLLETMSLRGLLPLGQHTQDCSLNSQVVDNLAIEASRLSLLL